MCRLAHRVDRFDQVNGFINNYADSYGTIVILSLKPRFTSTICRFKWILLSQFVLELREQAAVSSTPSSPSQLDDLGTFHSTVNFVRRTVEEDFCEPLYPVGPVVGLYHDEGNSSPPQHIENSDVSQMDTALEMEEETA